MHVVGPQLGLTQPGMTIVCGDSHTSTHGAFGAIAFGIGTSEVEHVLATQTLMQARPKTMAVTVNGSLPDGVTAKDLVLTLIAHTGTGGGQGYIVEYRGQAIEELSMEARMTICNMSIEWGAKAGLIAPDQTTFDYIAGPRRGAEGRRLGRRRRALEDAWSPTTTRRSTRRSCSTPSTMTPFVTWGTNPGQGVPLGARRARPGRTSTTRATRSPPRRRWSTWALEAGTPMREVKVDTVFVGSCTNGRIEDLRAAAEVIKGRTVADDTRLLVVPGSVRVRLQAEDEGLDVVFKEAGAEWRGAGLLDVPGHEPRPARSPGERSASTSNRNFEGRQGKGGRTHLVSPLVAAATAVTGTPRLARRPAAVLTRRPAEDRERRMEKFTQHTGTGAAAAPQQRRHRPDHPGGLPQAGHPHRLRGRAVRGLAQRPGVRPQPARVRRASACSSPARTSAPARRASTRCGRCMDYGFKVVISSRFADIFRGNSGKAGLLAAQVDAGRRRAAVDS